MLRLPPHHIPRSRLTEMCSRYQVVVGEAAGGYGKSVLAAELVDLWRSVGLWVELEQRDVTAPTLVARLRDAVRRAGFTDASSVAEADQGPAAALSSMLAALSTESCTFVIDDADNAGDDAWQLLEHLAKELDGDQRLIVLGRHLPEGARRLRRAEYFRLTAADLAMDADETLDLCRLGFGLEVGPDAARALDKATGGWTAATVLAAARAARTGETVGAVAEAATGPGHPAGAVAAMLDEALAALGPSSRPLLAQLARIPLLDAELVAIVSGDTGFFERALKAGIPFALGRGPWWDLPGPVRDHLASLSPRDPRTTRSAALEYRRRGELAPALELLLVSGDAREAAAVLAATTPEQEETLDTLEMRSHLEQLPDEAVDDHPALLLILARQLGNGGKYNLSLDLLDRAQDIARHAGDQELGRAAAVEMVKVRLLTDMNYPAAEKAARTILAEAGPSEELTRARANECLGLALCHTVDGAGRRDEAALDVADDCFASAFELYCSLGMRSAASSSAINRAAHIEFPRGQVSAAMDRIEQALLMVADRPRARAIALTWQALFAAEVGDYELCRTSGDEALRLGEQLKSPSVVAQSHWRLAVAASYMGDGATALHHLREAELSNGGSWGPLSAEFLSEAADLLDRVGHTALAVEYLGRADSGPKVAGRLLALAEAALEARHGEPALAERKLVALAQQRLDPREQWRATLLRALAAFRRGEHDQAGTLAAIAFEQAQRLGQPQAPLIRERAVTEQLAGLLTGTGQPAPPALQASSLPISLALLGRFELSVAGRPIALVPGQEVRLLKYVAVSDGQVHSEQAIETMWPEAGRAEGRNRLRTVLHRLRTAAGNVLARSGEMLVLDPSLRVDLLEFLAEAARAQALVGTDPALAAAIARGATVRYRGDLLPEDLDEDWAERPRQRARLAMLDLLGLCAKEAADRDDLDGLRRIVERAIEVDLAWSTPTLGGQP